MDEQNDIVRYRETVGRRDAIVESSDAIIPIPEVPNENLNLRTLMLVLCTTTFLICGAAIFDLLESDTEKVRQVILYARNPIIAYNENLLRMSRLKHNLTIRYNLTHQDFHEIHDVLQEMESHGNAADSQSSPRQWQFEGAFYYAVIVITAIGYGHATPRTPAGRIFTCFYAIFGIPLGLLVFQLVGQRLNILVTHIIIMVKKLFRMKNASVSASDLVTVVSMLLAVVVSISAHVFDRYENWGYLNSFYYCVITITTIGFGDYVPLQQTNEAVARSPEYVAFTMLFILGGLTVLSMCMNLMVLKFVSKTQIPSSRKDTDDQFAHLRRPASSERLKSTSVTETDGSDSTFSSIHL